MKSQFTFTGEGFKWKIQNHLTNTMEDVNAEQFSERKKDKLKKATAKLVKTSEYYITEMELTTTEKTALENDFACQLNDIRALTNTRNSDLFDLLLQKVAENLNINRNDNKELAKIDLNKTQYKLDLNEICDQFGITYRSAYNLCNDFLKILVDDLHFKFKAPKRKGDPFPTLGRFNAVSSSVIRKNTLVVNFTREFMFVLANTGNRLPMLTAGLNYDAKSLKYMGPLRRKLELYWWESLKEFKKKFGVNTRIKLANILPIFSGIDMSKNPIRFVNSLKDHLSHLEETGYFNCKFTGPKGAPLPADFRRYLDVNKDGALIRESDAGEGVSTVPRIKVNELLNNVYLTYTFIENPDDTDGKKKGKKADK